MSTQEFEAAARHARHRLDAMDREAAVAAACRGSGNPAWLAWLAEAGGITASSRVLDVGGGLGGPAAWLADRYGCRVVTTDPVTMAARVARASLGQSAVAAGGTQLPFPADTFDVSWLLGVLSVVEAPEAVLHEAGRVAAGLGAVVYVSTGAETITSAGSTFFTRSRLHRMLEDARWELTAGPVSPTLPPPPSWEAAEDISATDDGDSEQGWDQQGADQQGGDQQGARSGSDGRDDEAAVVREIDSGRVEALVLTAFRS